MKNEIITFNDPKSPIAEVFKTLRTNMQFMSNKEETLTLLVTSTVPGEGEKLGYLKLSSCICTNRKESCYYRFRYEKGETS